VCPVRGADVMQNFLTKRVNVGIGSVKTNQPNKTNQPKKQKKNPKNQPQTNHAKDYAVAE